MAKVVITLEDNEGGAGCTLTLEPENLFAIPQKDVTSAQGVARQVLLAIRDQNHVYDTETLKRPGNTEEKPAGDDGTT